MLIISRRLAGSSVFIIQPCFRHVNIEVRVALRILLEDPECIHAVQKQVYMEIAKLFCVNWKTIERNIRTLSTVAMRTDPQYLELLAQYPLTKRPTAVQFMEIILRSIRSKLA